MIISFLTYLSLCNGSGKIKVNRPDSLEKMYGYDFLNVQSQLMSIDFSGPK